MNGPLARVPISTKSRVDQRPQSLHVLGAQGIAPLALERLDQLAALGRHPYRPRISPSKAYRASEFLADLGDPTALAADHSTS